MKINKSWGGRFQQPTDEMVKFFNSSVNFDNILAPYDIKGSIAHVTMLYKCDIISKNEADIIINGLEKILTEINNNEFIWSDDLEDVHMNIEARLVDIVGDIGKKLHTARSRNDQVATDIRLYLRDNIKLIGNNITQLQLALITLAEKNTATIMPGFTHLQVAQPISFAHHLIAYYEMFQRDNARLKSCLQRINIMPLGSAALAGTTYPINRDITAKLLGFNGICQNSLDAVSDRDFAIEFLSAASIIMMHLSRLSEELVLWSSAQFDFIEIADSFTTGSSIMPNKKNPDVAELVRGKTGRVYGNLMAMLTIMKAQPLAYNKDNQEDKEPLFDTITTLNNSLKIYTGMIPAIRVKENNMLSSAIKGYATATDLADYLVKKGITFRDAHTVVGEIVAFAIDKGVDLGEMTLAEMQKFNKNINKDIFTVLSLTSSLNARNHLGGTAEKQVIKQIDKAKKSIYLQ